MENYSFIDNNYKEETARTKNVTEKKEFYFTPKMIIKKNFKKEKIITYSDDQIINCGKNMIELLNERIGTH
ncbi:hypothetical protein [Flavobacterium sp.]|uniref:hypothetical protein n=1 Tax=Flavobacterium sp. TaxID=239 RepID=UPI0037BFF43A